MDHELNEFGQPVGLPVSHWSPPPWPDRVTLSGAYCTLAPLDPATHGDSLYQANSTQPDDPSWTYMAYGPFRSRSEYQEWLSYSSEQLDPHFFAIVESQTQQALGVAAWLRIAPAMGSIEVGHIHYAPALRRTPAATEAMALMMQHVFQLGYRRYEWKCDALNEPSRRAAERLGFRFEGIFQQATVVKGRNRDTAWYAITDREWPAIQRAFEHWLAPENFDRSGQQIRSLQSFR